MGDIIQAILTCILFFIVISLLSCREPQRTSDGRCYITYYGKIYETSCETVKIKETTMIINKD